MQRWFLVFLQSLDNENMHRAHYKEKDREKKTKSSKLDRLEPEKKLWILNISFKTIYLLTTTIKRRHQLQSSAVCNFALT